MVKNKDYKNAAIAFKLLYELIDSMESADEIVFADELGIWMLPVNEEECIYYNVLAISKVYESKNFADEIIQLIKRDSHQSFRLNIFPTAIKFSNEEQEKYLNAEIKLQKIKLK